jgi:hypothetical protein
MVSRRACGRTFTFDRKRVQPKAPRPSPRTPAQRRRPAIRNGYLTTTTGISMRRLTGETVLPKSIPLIPRWPWPPMTRMSMVCS